MTGEGHARLVDYLLAIMLGGMALIAFINVLGRYLFSYSLAFTEEVTIHLFVWMTVLGSGVAFERSGHLGMVTVYGRLPRRWRRRLTLVHAVLAAGLYLVVDITLIRSITMEMTLFHASSAALGIPVWIYYAGVVLLSPFVFVGIWRGCRVRLAGDVASGEEA